MMLRTIRCDIPNCNEVLTEELENKGFPGWGSLIGGFYNDETNSENFYLCPQCKETIFKMFLCGKENLKIFSKMIKRKKQ